MLVIVLFFRGFVNKNLRGLGAVLSDGTAEIAKNKQLNHTPKGGDYRIDKKMRTDFFLMCETLQK